jgi:hypothetical protein
MSADILSDGSVNRCVLPNGCGQIPVAEAPIPLVAGKEPEAHESLCGVEELAGPSATMQSTKEGMDVFAPLDRRGIPNFDVSGPEPSFIDDGFAPLDISGSGWRMV